MLRPLRSAGNDGTVVIRDMPAAAAAATRVTHEAYGTVVVHGKTVGSGAGPLRSPATPLGGTQLAGPADYGATVVVVGSAPSGGMLQERPARLPARPTRASASGQDLDVAPRARASGAGGGAADTDGGYMAAVRAAAAEVAQRDARGARQSESPVSGPGWACRAARLALCGGHGDGPAWPSAAAPQRPTPAARLPASVLRSAVSASMSALFPAPLPRPPSVARRGGGLGPQRSGAHARAPGRHLRRRPGAATALHARRGRAAAGAAGSVRAPAGRGGRRGGKR
jgi:hypothetical protein